MTDSTASGNSETRRSAKFFVPNLSIAFRFAFALIISVIFVVFVTGSYSPPLSVFSGSELNASRLPEKDEGIKNTTATAARLHPSKPLIPEVDSTELSPASFTETKSTPVNAIPPPPYEQEHDLLHGLMTSSLENDHNCLSRYQSKFYLKDSHHIPSPDLLKSLRRYEELHKNCGPLSPNFKKNLFLLQSSSHEKQSKCKYLVWTPENGLGNQMISLASAFLYALLSDRVLLIDRGKDLHNLFCEPFPSSSWLLPLDFTLKFRSVFNKTHPARYGNILRRRTNPPMVYAHLSHDYEDEDKRFYCEKDQAQLNRFPWMVLKSDQYFVPALFLIPDYYQRLHRLFPEKETIFHLLARYLFHPGNSVWSLIRAQFQPGEKLGIQIRIHGSQTQTINLVTRQIVNCTSEKGLLTLTKSTYSSLKKKLVLITSLRPEFLALLKRVFRSSGLRFYQPSQEGRQQTGKVEHDEKALAEIYLLGLVDELLTSAWSTFGYVAQGIGGIRPWILRGPVHSFVPSPACVQDVSMEPCFHFPPNYDCLTGGFFLTRKVFPFMKQCRDRSPGLKLVDLKRKKMKPVP
ncbi:putative fucosyltransferase 8 [Wolffia australiana]